tara:strand:+ start:1497 stop:2306 length:810 start_codon:yes stop_codon:yes gene_type:complete
MAAPSGYKTFAAGEVLDASAGVMAYLMDQVVGVYANSSARATAIGTAAEGQVSYLKDTNKVYLYNGSAWEEVGGGIEWSGSTANGIGTYGSSSSIVSESTATYDGTTLQLTTSGGGLKLDGLNSSNANTLDDYEEGVFDWAVTAATSGSFTLNSGNNKGAYIRIGRLVHIQGTMEFDSVSSPVGTLRVGGLPFAFASDLAANSDRGGVYTTVIAMATGISDGIYTHAAVGQDFYDVNGGSGGTATDGTLANDLDAGSAIIVSGTYYCTP